MIIENRSGVQRYIFVELNPLKLTSTAKLKKTTYIFLYKND